MEKQQLHWNKAHKYNVEEKKQTTEVYLQKASIDLNLRTLPPKSWETAAL